MNANQKPYVVSADIYLLLTQWAQRRGFTLPPAEFFVELRRKFTEFFTAIFPMFELIPEKELVDGLAALVPANRFSICLDPIYYAPQADYRLEACRSFDPVLKNGEWVRSRAGVRDLHEQTNELIHEFKRSWKPSAVLVDDALFTGRMLASVSQNKSKPVVLVCVGVEVEHVGPHGSRWFTETTGIKVRSVRRYTEVIDQICERDFYPGVPLSGRVDAGDFRHPYIYPFGDPCDWASIPADEVGALSLFCIQQTIRLFEEIERASCKPVLHRDIDGKIATGGWHDERFVDALRKVAKKTFGKDFLRG